MITRQEVLSLLTQDAYYRKQQNWPLLTLNDYQMKQVKYQAEDMLYIKAEDMLYIKADIYEKRINHNDVKFNIRDDFPCADKLLEKFRGHLIAAGGAVMKAYYDIYRHSDIDFFFYDLDVNSASQMRIDAINYLFLSLKEYAAGETMNFYVQRNEFVTTISVEIGNEDEYLDDKVKVYQFIHRIYPNISSIIGGFDLSISMVAFDGENIFTTPLGMWSLKKRTIIIDTTRRSTSYEHRIIKYHTSYDINVLFPGISSEIINSIFSDEEKDYNYQVQKDENILPYFKIGNDKTFYRLRNPPTNKIEVEDRILDKTSDYSHKEVWSGSIHRINAKNLRFDRLAAVCSIVSFSDQDDITRLLLEETQNPNILFDIDYYRALAKNVREEHCNELTDFYQLLKCFGKLTPEVIKVRNTDQYDDYVKIMINKMIDNAKICHDNLVGVKWITQNPGRQWTSSINPIIENPREWYGKYYIPVIAGIPVEIETCLRLARLRSDWAVLPDDIFNIILSNIAKNYANEAWNYI